MKADCKELAIEFGRFLKNETVLNPDEGVYWEDEYWTIGEIFENWFEKIYKLNI